jgi:hypothetical protein
MKRGKVVAIRCEAVELNVAQESGIAGVKEQIDKAHALISGAQAYMRGFPEGTTLTMEDLESAHVLLDMAADELGSYTCLYRIRDGKLKESAHDSEIPECIIRRAQGDVHRHPDRGIHHLCSSWSLLREDVPSGRLSCGHSCR